MAGKIIINTEICKGCGLCVTVCPQKSITISKKSNKKGYFPAQTNNADSFDGLTTSCTGCCFCALICPDAAIEVFREDKAVVIEASKKNRKSSPLQNLPSTASGEQYSKT